MDIVERLRDAENQEFIQDRQIFQLTVCSEAADEIERLRKDFNTTLNSHFRQMEKIERLREVLECVVKYWDEWKSAPDDHLTELSIAALSLEEVVNIARSALKEKE